MRTHMHFHPRELFELMQSKEEREKSINYLKGHQIYKYDVISVVYIILVFVAFLWLKLSISDIISPNYSFDLVYEIKDGGPSSDYYVLDSGHERLINFSKDNKKIAMLNVPVDEECDYLYINNYCISPEGDVYISACEWTGMSVSRETIIKYSPDFSVQEKIIDYEYNDAPISKNRIAGLTVENGTISYLYKMDDSVRIVQIENGQESFREIDYKNAFNAILRVRIADDKVYILDKIGKILCFTGDECETIYDICENEQNIVPYDFAVDGEDCLFVDLKSGLLKKVTSVNTSEVVEKTQGTTVNIGKSGEILTCGDNYVQIYKDNEITTINKICKNSIELIIQIGSFVLLMIFINMMFYIISRVIFVISTLKISQFKRITFLVLAAVAVVIMLITNSMLNIFSSTYEEKIVEQLNLCARMVADSIKETDMAAVEYATDFDNESYRNMINAMEEVFYDGDDFCKSLYCDILKLDENNHAYAICYLDQTAGTYYPLNDEESEMVAKVYENKEYISAYSGDASGYYLFTKYPIFSEKGDVIGIIDVGIPDYVAYEQIDKMKKEVISAMIAVLLLLGVGVSEGSSILFGYERYKKEVRNNENIIPGYLLRILIFAIFAAYNMVSSFLPVYILKHSENVNLINESITASLPISVNIFIVGVMSLPCAALIRKMGVVKICVVSAICSVVGNGVLFFFTGYGAIFAGLILDGIGVGVLTNATYVLIAMIKDDVNRIEGFSIYNAACNSGTNFGIILGSILAVKFSQQDIFGVVAALWIVIIVFVVVLGKKLSDYIEVNNNQEVKKEGRSIWMLFKNKQTVSFFILIQNTYILYSAFVFFYLPIFCDELGYNETTVSVLFFVFSEIIVVFGDFLTKRVSSKFKENGMLLGIAIAIVGIMIFAFLSNMVGMCIALILLAIADAFEKPVSQETYLNMKAVKDCGEDNSIGVYNFTENIGQALGPTVFAKLMSSQVVLFSLSIFNASIAGLVLMYKLINKRNLKGEKS